jgi:hypothetical protein
MHTVAQIWTRTGTLQPIIAGCNPTKVVRLQLDAKLLERATCVSQARLELKHANVKAEEMPYIETELSPLRAFRISSMSGLSFPHRVR